MEELLTVRNVTICHGERALLSHLDFTVHAGEIVGIVGASGCGKSTLLSAILGTLPHGFAVTQGAINLAGNDLLPMSFDARRRLRGNEIGIVLQDCSSSFCPVRTIGAHILECAASYGMNDRDAVRTDALARLTQLGFDDPARIWESYPFMLSVGMHQRIGILLAMLARPRLLLADEPTSALDVLATRQVLDILRNLRDNFNHRQNSHHGDRDNRNDNHETSRPAILIVSHDLAALLRLADRVLVLADGKIIESAPTAALLARPQHAYTKKRLTASAPLLAVSRITKTFPNRDGSVKTALNDVSFTMQDGEILGIIGGSGCGKTTLAQILLRLLPPTAGTVTFGGIDITALYGIALHPIYRQIQMVFQQPASSFNPRRTLGDAIGESLLNRGMPGDERHACVRALLSACGLTEDFAARYPHEVSVGECQRAAIARALATAPRLLVCDEATSSLDAVIEQDILTLLQTLHEKERCGILFISHNIALVRNFCTRILVLQNGTRIEEGTPADIFRHPKHPYTKALLAAAW